MEIESLDWLQPGDKDDLSAETGMGKGKNRLTRSISPSQATPSSLKITTPYDGDDYHTLGLPPEDAPTEERKLANSSKYRPRYPPRLKLQAESKPARESFELYPYEGETQLRRAQLPDIKNRSREIITKIKKRRTISNAWFSRQRVVAAYPVTIIWLPESGFSFYTKYSKSK